MTITQQDIKKLWEQAQENAARLKGCEKPHDFKPVSGKSERTIGEKYECTKCKGRVDAIARSWYEKGRADERELHPGPAVAS